MTEEKTAKNRPVALTPLAYDSLHRLIERNPKEDGSQMSLCEMASTIIVRAEKQ